LPLHDFLPDEKLHETENLHDFAGMLVFDKWTCNTNVRQTVFEEAIAKSVSERQRTAAHVQETGTQGRVYKTTMIDQGFCFNAGEWNFRMHRCGLVRAQPAL
jgi:hypothetical protein